MGFFKKIFKGIGKIFKKIGKGIKKTFKSFGKFMDKIGIVGQIGMMFILPHMAGALFKGIGGAASYVGTGITGAAGQGTGLLSQLARGAGHVINGAGKFATNIGAKFTSIGNGIREFGKTAVNTLLPGKPFEAASSNFFGANGAWGKAVADFQATPDLFSGVFKQGAKVGVDTATESLIDVAVSPSRITPPEFLSKDPLTLKVKTISSKVGLTPTEYAAELAAETASKDALAQFSFDYADAATTGLSKTNEEVSKSLLTKGFDKFKTNFKEAPIKTVKDAVSTAGLVSQAIGGSEEIIMDDDYDYGSVSGSVSITPNPIITGAESVDNSLLNQYALTAVNNSYNPNYYGGNSPSPSDPYWLQWMNSNGNLSYG